MRKLRSATLLMIGSLVCAACPIAAFGISAGQIDNFQDGSLANWTSGGGGAGQVNVATGGPSGANDRFIQIASGATPLAPRLLMFNDTQWIGNFSAAGVSQVAMDLLNSGTTALPIRIAIREGTGGSTTPGYSSTTPFNLPADGAWHHAVFLLDAADLTGVNSPQALATDLANVKDFRVLSAAAPSTIGDMLTAQIGIDNITAVPEPTSALLMLSAVSVLCAMRIRRYG
jgi:hypothetical protein